MAKTYSGPERRQFVRIDFTTPLACKVCKKETISKILDGYTADISRGGILCNIKDRVKKNDILWLSFDRSGLSFCADLEKRSLIYQNGVIGKVVRAEPKKDKTFEVGIQFITREEKNLSNIYPKIHFIQQAEAHG
jgi:c-di-GMP-binding flagellar brake protein YcgR